MRSVFHVHPLKDVKSYWSDEEDLDDYGSDDDLEPAFKRHKADPRR